MDDALLRYYEDELTFIRKMGTEFAKKYPKIAGRLLLEPDKCEDPHTERLIEAFAFLAARIHRKIEDDFPEITESLLGIVYPHYLVPIPSMSVVRFEPLKRAVPPGGYAIGRNTSLYSKQVKGSPCHFVTSYPVTLWPLEVASARLQEPKRAVKGSQQALVLQLKTENNLSFSQLGCDRLRFFLNGPAQHVFPLYELLFNRVCHLAGESNARGRREEIPFSPQDIVPVGFEPEEGILPLPPRSFPGYLLLFEYFCFPEKFLFFDLKGLDRLKGKELGDTLELWFYLDRPAKAGLVVNPETFCLQAAPAVNLFKRVAEPIWVDQTRTEYQVIPDVGRLDSTEVYSVDSVTAPGPVEFHPFYSVRRHLEAEEDRGQRAFWRATRRPSGRKGDNGTEVFLSFTDWDLKPADPGVETLMVNVTCTNRDLPARLPFGDPSGDLETELSGPVARVHCLVKPTAARRPNLGAALQWRLVSHLSLNYLSLVEGGEEALKEILKLYDFDNSPVTRQQVEGIVSVQSEYSTKRIGGAFCRGVQVKIQFDEEKYVGAGLYLFASVLERFLGQYVSVNSFSQLTARSLQKAEVLKTWPPRNGNRILL